MSNKTSTVAATAFTRSRHPNLPAEVVAGEDVWVWSAAEQRAGNAPQCHETQTEWVCVNRVAILEQLTASIGEINQPISAVVLNAEAALQLLLTQPSDTEAVRRLLVCIVQDGMRSGDVVNRTRALIENARPADTDSES
jgi:C4-dicarboxylate-specific signal transduction histidine kinase